MFYPEFFPNGYRHGRNIALQQSGVLRDDETLDELRAGIYAARGRLEVEPGAGK